MTSFSIDQLFLPTSIIFFSTLLISFCFTRSFFLSLSTSFIKSGLFFTYFNMFFDGTFTYLDDWNYVDGGILFLKNGIFLSNIFENWATALMIGNGSHFLYYLYNAYSFLIFGEYYFAPVVLNILITLFISLIGTLIVKYEFNFNNRQKIYFYFFLMLHPDILAWSSFINIKDIVVLFLHILTLYSISLYYRKKYAPALILIIICFSFLSFLRFYTPFLFAIAFILSQIKFSRLKLTHCFIALIVICCVIIILGNRINEAYYLLLQDISNPLTGFFRILLSPIPFHTEPSYNFLNLPMIFHWATFPILLEGIIQIKRMKTPFSRFFVFYILTFLILYAIYNELQGPRHRVQLDYAIVVFQFIGFYKLINSKSFKKVLLFIKS